MLALTETPMPTPSMTVAPEAVTPGFAGFAAIVIVLIAVFLLIWDMNRRIRRVRYREEVREELDAEEAAQADETTADPERDADLPDAGHGDEPPRT
ncbi:MULTISPECIES: hypothetical protein [unclassified Microbacterium]|uniref:hypothetical protein n=1 Tax=unclassified Microbacterium TaxID=2609290 RepID=UPI000EAABA4E|nr:MULTISPECIES: hypothetical protein [unclassified Microbacterium]MBT2485263.1 hypothetical protein [Microbacterium sp. ISL-108]RKN68081.1 hypothetical protein D7252_11125 [Microbacterium sp. CGR2]